MGINSLLDLGGPVVYILLILSIYALAVILYKLHVFYKVEFLIIKIYLQVLISGCQIKKRKHMIN